MTAAAYQTKRETDRDARLQRSPRRVHDLIRAAIRTAEVGAIEHLFTLCGEPGKAHEMHVISGLSN
jgi:hypothetical protein